MKTAICASASVILGLAALLACGQSPTFTSPTSPNRPAAKPDEVKFLYPEQVRVPSGKSTAVVLHFRVDPGMHINSHTPPDAFLIPTLLSIPVGAGVKLDAANYPDGTEFKPEGDPQMKLSVYTGEFTIQARITALPGNHLVEAKLRYQACDENACMPPKTITVAIDVIGK
jgi:hypothetical protein